MCRRWDRQARYGPLQFTLHCFEPRRQGFAEAQTTFKERNFVRLDTAVMAFHPCI